MIDVSCCNICFDGVFGEVTFERRKRAILHCLVATNENRVFLRQLNFDHSRRCSTAFKHDINMVAKKRSSQRLRQTGSQFNLMSSPSAYLPARSLNSPPKMDYATQPSLKRYTSRQTQAIQST